jgi:hypothetical protein
MHQVPWVALVIGKFLCNSNVSVEILDQNLEIAIQLEERKAGLPTT